MSRWEPAGWEPPAGPRQLMLLQSLEPFFFSLRGKGGCFSQKQAPALLPPSAWQRRDDAWSTLQCLLSGVEQHLHHL